MTRRPVAAVRTILLAVLLGLAAAVAVTADGGVFSERAAELGVGFRHVNGMTGKLYFVEMMGAGGALFDYDNDGDLDLYLVQGNRLDGAPDPDLKDRLYRNDLAVRTDGLRHLEFTDVTEEAGLRATGYGMGVATGDFDGDGWIDLYVTNFGANQLWRNNGAGKGAVTFTDVTAASGTDDVSWSVSASFFDGDGDGGLDLYVVNYVNFSVTDHKFCPAPTGGRDYCGPLAYDPLPDRFFRNQGGAAGRTAFSEVTRGAGIRQAASGMGVVSGDFDGDGRSDLYVTNDAMANQLWLNRAVEAGGGQPSPVTFLDDALLAGCAFNLDGQPEASMGVAAGDVDGDGREDLVVTHLIHETNTLYLSRGRTAEASFIDATARSGLGTPSWLYTGFGVALLDYDNDGWLDVLVANGAVRLFDRDLLEPGAGRETVAAGRTLEQPNQLFHNRGGGADGRVAFEDVSAWGGEAFALSEVSRGVSHGDLDNDGDVDAVIHNNNGPVRLLINEVGQDNGWLGVRLVGGPGQPRDMLGAEAELRRPGRVLRRRVRTDGSYASASDSRLLFGLGADRSPATLRVYWPSGRVEEWSAVPSGRYSTLREGEGRAVEK